MAIVDNRNSKTFNMRAFGYSVAQATANGKEYEIFAFGDALEIHEKGRPGIFFEYSYKDIILLAIAELGASK